MNKIGRLLYFILGIIAAAAFALWNSFTFSYEVNLAQIINLLLGLVIAIWIQHLMRQKGDIRKAEKELIAAQVKVVHTSIIGIRDAFIERYQSKGKEGKASKNIVFQLRYLANSLSIVETALKCCKAGPCMVIFESVKREYFQYKATLTGNGFPEIAYSVAIYGREEALFRNICEKIMLLNLDIAKLD